MFYDIKLDGLYFTAKIESYDLRSCQLDELDVNNDDECLELEVQGEIYIYKNGKITAIWAEASFNGKTTIVSVTKGLNKILTQKVLDNGEHLADEWLYENTASK